MYIVVGMPSVLLVDVDVPVVTKVVVETLVPADEESYQ